MLIKDATAITGGLSKPSKMPGYAYGLPAQRCKVGGRLQLVANSVCDGCYALKGMYQFDVVQTAQERRYQSLDHPDWVEAMVTLISKRGPYFRWHDSGDIRDLDHLSRIIDVVKATPSVRHWMPTREYKVVNLWRQLYGEFPANLVVRLSAHMVDGDAPSGYGLPTSTVSSNGGRTCPAPDQGNSCQDCRACWSGDVGNVAYGHH